GVGVHDPVEGVGGEDVVGGNRIGEDRGPVRGGGVRLGRRSGFGVGSATKARGAVAVTGGVPGRGDVRGSQIDRTRIAGHPRGVCIAFVCRRHLVTDLPFVYRSILTRDQETTLRLSTHSSLETN